jgi:hypothetical protein
LSVPNYREDVAHAASRYPNEWRSAHTGGADTEAFIRLLARDLHAIDSRIGLNGKRGNPDDLSDDALCFKGEGAQYDPTNGNSPVSVIDVIGGAGGPNPVPQWTTFSDRHAGAWVKPSGSVIIVPAPKPCPDPSAHVPKPPVPYPDEPTFWAAYELSVVAAYAEKGRPLDSQAFRWFTRVAYDIAAHRMDPIAAAAKHLAALKLALG